MQERHSLFSCSADGIFIIPRPTGPAKDRPEDRLHPGYPADDDTGSPGQNRAMTVKKNSGNECACYGALMSRAVKLLLLRHPFELFLHHRDVMVERLGLEHPFDDGAAHR